MDEILKTVGAIVIAVVLLSSVGLILAFPVKWCWNYSVVHIWNLPVITWGQAWCLSFLAGMLIKSSSANKSK